MTEHPEFLEFKEVPDYDTAIAHPLRGDEKSLYLINQILESTKIGKTDPYGQLLFSLADQNVKGRDAKKHWQYMLAHKSEIEVKIGRPVGIRVAALDYFDVIGDPEAYLSKMSGRTPSQKEPEDGDWLSHVFSYKFFQERLQEEFLRLKRYRYSLSLVLVDVDDFAHINEKYGFKTGDLLLTRVVKIIKRNIRTVDILTRFAGDQFALILPHANRREAQELAERIRKTVEERSKFFKEAPEGVNVTCAVIQFDGKESTSSEITNRARSLLEKGKAQRRNFVHADS